MQISYDIVQIQCNSSAPGLFGDLRHDIDGCFLPGVDSPEVGIMPFKILNCSRC